MRKQKLLMLLALTMAVIVTSASASLLLYEPFEYTGTQLTGQGGAMGTVGTWTSNDATGNVSWGLYQEGTLSGALLSDGTTPVTFDGTVANLPTRGGYAGHNPGGYKLNADIGLAPSVTASFQSGATTWISYVSVQAFNLNAEQPNLVIGTIPAPTGSRGDDYGGIGTGGSGFGTGGGPNRDNRTSIYPMFYTTGQYNNVQGPIPGNVYTSNAATFVDATGAIPWQSSDADGFGAANIIVVKIQWDADTGGADIISLARFLETEEITEAAFNAQIVARPNLTSANWAAANKPNLDQTQLDTLTFMGIKYFVDEIRIGTKFKDIVAASVDYSPPDGETVPAGNVELSWANVEATEPNDVYVDVWFGTDPCTPGPGTWEELTLDPPSGLDVNDVTVESLTDGKYYWQVISDIGEPNIIEGDLHYFYVQSDFPPESVEIVTAAYGNSDLMTWSGQSVDLIADVVDDGQSNLTYAWTADPLPTGVTVDFAPDAADPAPTVTIDKVPYLETFVANAGFENPAIADDSYIYIEGGVSSWSTMWSVPSSGIWATAAYQGGIWDPNSGADYPSGIPEGENVAWLETDHVSDHCFYQQLNQTIQPSTTYQLSVKVGNPSLYNGGPTADYRLEIVGNGVAAVSGGTSPADNTTWLSASCSYTSGAAGSDPHVGQPLAIRLIGEAYGTELDNGYEIDFDQVVMMIDGESGQMVYDSSVPAVTITVNVNDENNPTSVTDTMEIDVYPDACAMARIGEGKAAANPGDLNADCNTTIVDLAVIAAKWLNDIGLSAPQPK